MRIRCAVVAFAVLLLAACGQGTPERAATDDGRSGDETSSTTGDATTDTDGGDTPSTAGDGTAHGSASTVAAERRAVGSGAAGAAGPGSTGYTVPVEESPATTFAGHAARPSRYVAVTRTGELMAGPNRLLQYDDPTAQPEPEGGAFSITSAVLTPDGSTIYFDTCCEPAGGSLRRIPFAGGKAEDVAAGFDPAISDDGSLLAYATLDAIVVRDLRTGRERRHVDADHDGTLRWPALSPKADAVAYVRSAKDADATELVVVSLTVAGFGPPKVVRGPAATRWDLPRFRSDGNVLITEQCCPHQGRLDGRATNVIVDVPSGQPTTRIDLPGLVLDAERDAARQWSLITYADGTTVWEAAGGRQRLGTGFVSADW